MTFMKQPVTLRDYMNLNSDDQERILNICIGYDRENNDTLRSVTNYMDMFGIPKTRVYVMNVRERI